MKDNFKTLIILNAIICILSFLISFYFWGIVSILNLWFFWWLNSRSDDEIMNDRNYILVLGIIDILILKIISGAIALSTYFNLNNESKFRNFFVKEKKPVVKVDPQIRKIDILLKLGVAMVFIAGFVFATTGWYSLNSIIKIFIFFIIAALFIGLSKFSEKYIKIKSTIYLYWILGMSFIVMLFFTAGYGAVFGNVFSLIGNGKLLYLSFCSLIISVLGYITYFNFKDKSFLNLVYGGIFFILLFLSEHFGLLLESFLALVLLIITVIRFVEFDKDKDIYTLVIFSNILICILGVVFMCFIGIYESLLPVVIASSLFIFNLYRHIYNYKESDFNMFASIVAYILIIPSLMLFISSVTEWVIISVIFVTLLYFVSFLYKNKILKNSSLIFADVVTILAFVISSSDSAWLPLFVSVFSILVCLICTLVDNLDDYSFEVFIHPVKLAMLLFGSIYLLNSYINLSNVMGYWMSFTLIIYILIYCLSRNNTLTNIYEKFSVVAIIICLLFTGTINNLVISLTIFIGILLFYADVTWTKDRTRGFKLFIYILLLFNIIISMYAIEDSLFYYLDLNSNYYLANILSIGLFTLSAVLNRKDEVKLNLALFAVVLPIWILIETCVDVYWVSIVLPSILVYYLTFILVRLEKKSIIVKNVIGSIGYSYSFLLVVFSSNYYVLAYSFIILAISLALGYLDKKSNALFKVSVVWIVLLIVYQLKEFWNLIPAWLYLLIGGILLIIFATYKQLKIVERNEKDGKKE